MVLLNPKCAVRRPIVMGEQRVGSHRDCDRSNPLGVVESGTRKGGRRAASPDVDVERYSSDVLRPLTAACVFRDCSLRIQSSPPERRACRTLMRQAAMKWRQGLEMGDL